MSDDESKVEALRIAGAITTKADIGDRWFAFHTDGKEVVRIYADGRVIKNEGIEWDEAAQSFWTAVDAARSSPFGAALGGLQITLKPTDEFVPLAGGALRAWNGHDDAGVQVVALIASVSPLSHEPAVNERYARILKETPVPGVKPQ